MYLFDDLPRELLKLILECLRSSVGDLIRLSAVCKSWQILGDSIRQQQQQQQHIGPFVLLRPVSKTDHHTIHHLFDLYKNRSHEIVGLVIPTTGYTLILNSWNEWILTCTCADRFDRKYDNIRFLNLLSKEEIEIPRIYHLVKVILSSTTPLGLNSFFMAIFGEERKLAFYGGKKKKWNVPISELGQYYSDIIYFKGDFYAVDDHGNLELLYNINEEPKLLKVASSVETTKFNNLMLYLVESCGDLFLIIRTFGLRNDDRKCEAYKLNSSRGMWQKVNSLGDGYSTFFIGYHVSVSVSTKDFPVKRNCIYYTASIDGERDVFNLSTDQFESNLLFS